MMNKIQITNVFIVNEGEIFQGCVYIDNGLISHVQRIDFCQTKAEDGYEVLDGGGNILMPGVIDDQVHFRDPGLTSKADIFTESKAAVAGGVTSFMDMPNTIPNTLTQDILEDKYKMAAEKSVANYSFYMGASNNNLEEILKVDPKTVCGIKIFMGASTGNMLVDDKDALDGIFKNSKMLITVHCEDESTIRENIEKAKSEFGEKVPISKHPEIRSEEACYLSSSFAVALAKKYNTRLHILHLSTEKELSLFDNKLPLKDKRITAEVCVHHLWFSDRDYAKHGTRIKWNPAIKKESDRNALFQALLDDKLDVIATDHAPHTIGEKDNSYFKAPSGGPLVQHSLVAMLEFYLDGKISIEKLVEKMCHAPAECYQIEKRGYIRKGYHADLVIVNTNKEWTVEKDNILYKCKWSPFEGQTFRSSIMYTFVNGQLVYNNGTINEGIRGQRLLFNR